MQWPVGPPGLFMNSGDVWLCVVEGKGRDWGFGVCMVEGEGGEGGCRWLPVEPVHEGWS